MARFPKDEPGGNIAINYTPSASAIPFHECDLQVKAICGPVGSGKSTLAIWDFFLLCREATVPVRGLVVRESYRQLHDSTRQTVQEWFGALGHYVKSEETLHLRMPGLDGVTRDHQLMFRHGRRPEEVSNLLSTEYGFIWLEEVVPGIELKNMVVGGGLPQELFDMVLMRQRQKGLHRMHTILTFNPPSKFHWVYRTFFLPTTEELTAKGMALFRQPPFENRINLPPNYYERLLTQLGEDLARRFVYGEPVTIYPGRRVFPEALEQVHFAENLKPVPKVPYVLGFDFGLTPVVLIAQVLPNGRLQVYKEIQFWSSGLEKLAEFLMQVLHDEYPDFDFEHHRGWGDPAGQDRSQADEKTCFDVLRARGFVIQAGQQDPHLRKEAVRQRMSRIDENGIPALRIDKQKCQILCEGLLGGYRYPRASDGQVGHRPLKNEFSHSCDALQYLCTGEFSVFTGKGIAGPPPRVAYDPFAPLSAPRAGSRTSWMAR